mgnify:CR=1 FL=1|jgi:hypothetical protein
MDAVRWVRFRVRNPALTGGLPHVPSGTGAAARTYSAFVHADVLALFKHVTHKGQCSMHADMQELCRCYDVPLDACLTCYITAAVVDGARLVHDLRCPCADTDLHDTPCHEAPPPVRPCRQWSGATVILHADVRAHDVEQLGWCLHVLVESLERCRIDGTVEPPVLTPEQSALITAFMSDANMHLSSLEPWQAHALRALREATIAVAAPLKF